MATRSQPRLLRFDPYEAAPVVEAMTAMAERGQGWMNFEPVIPDPDQPPPNASGGGFLSNRGPAIPLCTWTPPPTTRRGTPGLQSIGLQHGLAAKARPVLAEVGLEVPAGWAVRSDHPKRGMVIELAPDVALATVLDWLLAAGEVLAARAEIAISGRWLAVIYEG
jgi:hypothetical protein